MTILQLQSIPVNVTIYPNPYAVQDGEYVETTLADLLADPERGRSKEDLPYIATHRLRPGGRRRVEHVEAIGPVLLLDSDEWSEDAERRLSTIPGLWIVHESPSGRPGRVRIWCVCSRAVTAREYKTLYRILQSKIHVLDRQCSHAGQGYYLGVCFDGDLTIRVYGSAPLDVDQFDLHDDAPPMPAPTLADLGAWGADWCAAQAWDQISSMQPAERGERHRALFKVAQACRDWNVSLDATRRIVLQWNGAHCSPPEDERTIEQQILANVDRYRRNPVGCMLAVACKISLDHTQTLDRVTQILRYRCESLFVRDGQIIEIGPDNVLHAVEIDRLSEIVSANVQMVHWDPGSRTRPAMWVRCAAPPWVARELAARPTHALRRLVSIAALPVLRDDGTVLTAPGWDPASKIYLETGEDIPPNPTPADAHAAASRVMELFEQFPLDPEGRAVVLAYLLTAVARSYVQGPVPVLVLDANRPQVGKSKLAELIGTVCTGRRPTSRAWDGDRSRMLDTLHAAVSSDPRVVFFDNVENGGLLASSTLDGALTHQKISRRKLFAHHMIDLTFAPLVLVTGNGLRIGSDLAPRAIHVRLSSRLEDPAQRDDLKIPNLHAHVLDSLPQITADLLTIWRAWILAGKPGSGVKPWATFEGWTCVRELVRWLGQPDPADARKGAKERDLDSDVVTLLHGWILRRFPDGASATQLAGSLERRRFAGAADAEDDEDRAELAGKMAVLCNGDMDAFHVGIQLGRFADRVAGHRVLEKKETKGRIRWHVREL